jgi:excisionase family DNA binding protein
MPEDQDTYLAARSYITIKEAARHLGVCYHSVWRRMGKEDGPPARKIGPLWRIPKDEFIEWAKKPVIR